eukprot:scaffold491_cov188-Pinguiococcus_pyrenoidosus.AAC.3
MEPTSAVNRRNRDAQQGARGGERSDWRQSASPTVVTSSEASDSDDVFESAMAPSQSAMATSQSAQTLGDNPPASWYLRCPPEVSATPVRRLSLPEPPIMPWHVFPRGTFRDQYAYVTSDEPQAQQDGGSERCPACGQVAASQPSAVEEVVANRFRMTSRLLTTTSAHFDKRRKRTWMADQPQHGTFSHTDDEFLFIYERFAAALEERLAALDADAVSVLFQEVSEEDSTQSAERIASSITHCFDQILRVPTSGMGQQPRGISRRGPTPSSNPIPEDEDRIEDS